MSGSCCSNESEVMILACSGGSNVGQLTNQAAVELTRDGHGKMFCLAGIGGGIQGFVKSAKENPKIMVLDGCQVGCAKAILEREGVEFHSYVIVTNLGIEKVKDSRFPVDGSDLERVKLAGKAAVSWSLDALRGRRCEG